ncbi:adenylate/guanylate cyclase domain-containing protein [soil metagenome]
MADKPDQRRLAAIAVADVVGYSRLMEADETGTLAALKQRRTAILEPVVRAHGGRVVKVMGDGVLIEFASAVNAVKAALDLQHQFAAANENLPEVRHIKLRIGINLGDVIGEGSDIYGDGVNIAARLEGLAEPGMIVVSGTVHDHVTGKLAHRFDDLGERTLKNIQRPVRVFRVVEAALRVMDPSPPEPPGRASIAVLPFTNMSSDPEQEFFADGLTEDLITDLSKVPGLFVIARHSTFAYKGKAIDIRQAARELGVSHVVEGSVRRSASRVRVTVQLIEAAAGGHIWADRFDRNLEEIFAVQDEVVGKIVSALADALPLARSAPKRRAPNIEAYDLFVRARALSLHSPEDNRSARPLLERAIELDPGFAEAHAWLAMNLHFYWMYLGQEDSRVRVMALARRAISLDPSNADARVILGYVLIFSGDGDLDGGREQYRIALDLNRNHADAWLFLGDLEVLDGRPEAAVRAGQNAFRLNPLPPSYYYWLFGWILYSARRYEEVVALLGHGNARDTSSLRILAGALAHLGQLDEAREVARRFLIALPRFTVSSWAKTLPFRDPSDLHHLMEGYLKAGLPE